MIAVVRALGVVIWSILMISSSLVVLLFTWNTRWPVAMARCMWAPGVLWVCGIRLEVSSAAQLTDDSYVFVANHQSYVDIPLLFRAIPHNLHFVAKKELKKVPFLGWYMMATGMIFIDRSNRNKAIESLRRAARLISKGKSVLMFPEGTRSKNGQVSPFKKGPFMLAKDAGVKVVPVGIDMPDHTYHVGRFGVTHVKVAIGAPVTYEQDEHVSKLIDAVHAQVEQLSARGVRVSG
ncbi:lysophospholipid acyltransferase family protein [Marinoscillum furvescens]|uniref:1-acyl-sn-glycerol-3-phosphate acyltransferase n=1 Tax=Marinoscillum furvescens DSM 4134 TaxID=1122208 RepID=A0A3D9L121_MARFU|nr:lysophospholipid acyltransferase family protein [Marinoscillum furvescens]RED95575.1 1-acyl-sn-glycerol-3-phosphate acyltransferase [Marinoscillum furvescens DSM 4134]